MRLCGDEGIREVLITTACSAEIIRQLNVVGSKIENGRRGVETGESESCAFLTGDPVEEENDLVLGNSCQVLSNVGLLSGCTVRFSESQQTGTVYILYNDSNVEIKSLVILGP